jgi:hypothetical protein
MARNSLKQKEIETTDTKKQNQEESVGCNEAIQKKAYELYEKRGCCSGHDQDDWLEAEKTVTSGNKRSRE